MSGPAVSAARFGPRQAQPIADMIGDASSILDGLFTRPDANDLPPMARAAMEANKRIREIAARKFGDRDGEDLLEFLCDSTLRRPTFLTQVGMPLEQVALMGSFREGMAATVYLLLAWIAEGRSEQQPNREGTHENSTRTARKREPSADRKSTRPHDNGPRRRKR